jgi:ubiquinone/menaquinone biosynthesis C-methylase UbiE
MRSVMTTIGPDPVSREAYDKLASSYSARAPTKPHNAYYERPATLSLLGDVRGRRVLDAACGPGIYAEILADRGAEVVGFDASEKMVALARERLRGRMEVRRANLEEPLEWLKDDSFDLVVSALAMDYVEDWRVPLSEFYRVLKPAGKLVFSVEHPTFKFVEYVYQGEASYFETELVGMEWRGFAESVWMPSYRRSLGAMVDAILGSGFVFAGMLEPQPDERFRAADPEEYERLSRMPGFLCFLGHKPGVP